MVKMFAPKDAIQIAKSIFVNSGFYIASRGEDSFYFRHLKYPGKKVRLSDHKSTKVVDLFDELIFDYTTIMGDIEVRSKKLIAKVMR